MRIGFDAKRAFLNNTGLGQYSRNLLSALFACYPQHRYHLMTTKRSDTFQPPDTGNISIHTPKGVYKTFPALWRSNGVRHDLKQLGVQLYHGLSHELPVGVHRSGIKTVVTMHDLIFERHPEQYKPIDVAIYRKKFKYASTHADAVIAISEQTKQDLISYYNIPEHKIHVCNQSCNLAFQEVVNTAERERVRTKYNLPQRYLLSVGSVIERKNLLTVCKALHSLKGKLDIPLVVIGKGGDYMKKVQQYIREQGMEQQVLFLSERNGGVDSQDMPAIYQQAHVMLYPSVFEGFGIPILEALWSKLPVITSNLSCMPETGGDAARYVDPLSAEDMANAIYEVATNATLREDMVQKGVHHARKFAPDTCASSVMDVYESLV